MGEGDESVEEFRVRSTGMRKIVITSLFLRGKVYQQTQLITGKKENI